MRPKSARRRSSTAAYSLDPENYAGRAALAIGALRRLATAGFALAAEARRGVAARFAFTAAIFFATGLAFTTVFDFVFAGAIVFAAAGFAFKAAVFDFAGAAFLAAAGFALAVAIFAFAGAAFFAAAGLAFAFTVLAVERAAVAAFALVPGFGFAAVALLDDFAIAAPRKTNSGVLEATQP